MWCAWALPAILLTVGTIRAFAVAPTRQGALVEMHCQSKYGVKAELTWVTINFEVVLATFVDKFCWFFPSLEQRYTWIVGCLWNEKNVLLHGESVTLLKQVKITCCLLRQDAFRTVKYHRILRYLHGYLVSCVFALEI